MNLPEIKLEEKAVAVTSATSSKLADFNGYEDAKVLQVLDGDTVKVQYANGNITDVRLATGMKDFSIDTTETNKEYIEGNENPFTLGNNVQTDIDLVAFLTGKDAKYVTKEDMYNHANYSQNVLANQVSGLSGVKFDNTIQYSPIDISNDDVIVKVKSLGQDKYQRTLGDIINPNTPDTSIATSIRDNAIINTRPNFNTSIKIAQITADDSARNNRNFLSDIGQLASSGIAQYGADVVDALLPQSIVDNIDANRRKQGKVTIQELTNSETSAIAADRLLGINHTVRSDMEQEMSQGLTELKSGNVLEGLTLIGKNSLNILASSPVQSIAVTAASMLNPVGALASLSIGASASTFDSMEEYETNNNGQKMSLERTLGTFAGNLGLMAAESVLVGQVGKLVLPAKGTKSTLFSPVIESLSATSGIPAKTIALNTIEAIVKGSVGEFTQEFTEGAFNTFMSQARQDPEKVLSFFEVALSEENLDGAIIGAIVGGTLPTVGGVASAPIRYRQEVRKAVSSEALNAYTATGQEANSEVTNNAVANLNTIRNKPVVTSKEELDAILAEIDAITNTEGVSIGVIQAAEVVKTELMLAAKNAGYTQVNRDAGISDVDFAKRVISHSDPKQVNGEKNRTEVLKNFGLDEKQRKYLTAYDVSQDVKNGSSGYNHYIRTINTITPILSTLKANSPDNPNIEKFSKDLSKAKTGLGRLYTNQLGKLRSATIAMKKLSATEFPNVKFKYNNSNYAFHKSTTIKGQGLVDIIFDVINDIATMGSANTTLFETNPLEYIVPIKEFLDAYEAFLKDSGVPLEDTDSMVDISAVRELVEGVLKNASESDIKVFETKTDTKSKTTETPKKTVSEDVKQDTVEEPPLPEFNYYVEVDSLGNEYVPVAGIDFDDTIDMSEAITEEFVPDTYYDELSDPSSIEGNNSFGNTTPNIVAKDVDTSEYTTFIDGKSVPIALSPKSNIKSDALEFLHKMLKRISKSNTNRATNTQLGVALDSIREYVQNYDKKYRDFLLYNILDRQKAKHSSLTLAEEKVLETYEANKDKLYKRYNYLLEKTKDYRNKPLESLTIPENNAVRELQNLKSLERLGKHFGNILAINYQLNDTMTDHRQALEEEQSLVKKLESTSLKPDRRIELKAELKDVRNRMKKNNYPKTIMQLERLLTSQIEALPNIATENIYNGSLGTSIKDTVYKTSTQTDSKPKFNLESVRVSRGVTNTMGFNQVKSNNKIMLQVKKVLSTVLDISAIGTRVKNDSPALGLLFNSTMANVIKQTGYAFDSYIKSKNPDNYATYVQNKMDDTMSYAIGYGVYQFLTENASMFLPTEESVEKRFSLENAYTPDTAGVYMEISKEYGMTRSSVADIIGKIIFQNLGLEKNTEFQGYGDYEAIVNNLGNIAISYAEAEGFLKASTYKADFYIQHDTNFVRMYNDSDTSPFTDANNVHGKAMNIIELNQRTAKILEAFAENTLPFTTIPIGNVALPRIVPAKQVTKAKIQKRTEFNATEEHVRALNILQSNKYVLNTEMVQFVKDNIELIMQYMKYEIDLSTKTYDDIRGIIGSNGTTQTIAGSNGMIVKEVLDLIQLLDSDYNQGLYFMYSIVSNGRYIMNSTTVNPSIFKKLQRWLLVTENTFSDIDTTDDNVMNALYFGLAQSFDLTKSDDFIQAFGKHILTVPAKQLREQLLNGTLIDSEMEIPNYGKVKLKMEQIGQLLTAIQTIGNYQTMVAQGNTTFQNTLAIEVDSATSGYFFRVMQYPESFTKTSFNSSERFEQLANRVGITFLNPADMDLDQPFEIHGKKAQEGFLDMYQSVSTEIDLVPVDFAYEHILSNLTKEQSAKAISWLNEKTIQDWYGALIDFLPKPEMVDGQIVVPSELRKMFKSPVMVFNYGAGKESVKRGLATTILNGVLSTYLKASDKIRNKQELSEYEVGILDFMVKQVTPYLVNKDISLQEQLQTTPLYMIKLKLNNKEVSLDKVFLGIFGNTYGQAAWDALETQFKNVIPYTTIVNSTHALLGDIFVAQFNAEILALQQRQEVVTQQDVDAIIEKLLPYIPSIRLPSSTDLRSNAPMIKTGNTRNGEVTQSYTYKDVDYVSSANTSVSVRGFHSTTSYAGAVGTHYLDGLTMTRVINILKDNNIAFLPVHDALVVSPHTLATSSSSYNRSVFNVNTEVALLNEAYEAYQRTMEHAKNTNPELYAKLQDKVVVLPNTIRAMIVESLQSGEELYSFVSNLQSAKRGNNITMTEFGKILAIMNEKNNINRKTFFENTIVVGNLDGTQGTAIVNIPYKKNNSFIHSRVSSLRNKKGISGRLKSTINDEMVNSSLGYSGSDPDSFMSNEERTKLNTRALTDKNARLEIVDKLEAVDTKKSDPETLQLIKDFLTHMDTSFLSDVDVFVQMSNTAYNQGLINLNNDIIIDLRRDDGDIRTPVSYIDKSAVEVYGHEMAHAIVDMVIFNDKVYGMETEVRQLRELQKLASKHLTVEDLLPPNPTDYDIQRATALLKYMFAGDRGLAEFAAHAMTNVNVRKKLNTIQLVKEPTKMTLIDKVVKLIKKIADVFSGRSKIGTLMPTVMGVAEGVRPIKQDLTVLHGIDRLTSRMSRANRQATNELQKKAKALGSMFKMVSKTLQKGNDKLSPMVKFALNWYDRLGLKAPKLASNPTNLDYAKYFTQFLAAVMFSENTRAKIPTVLNFLDLFNVITPTGTIQTIFRDFTDNTQEENELEALGLLRESIDNNARHLEAVIRDSLYEAFEVDLTDEQTTALTQALLYTDITALTTNVTELKELFSSPEEVQIRIEGVLQEIHNILDASTTEDFDRDYSINMITGHSYMLSKYMMTGRGNEAVRVNSSAIAIALEEQGAIPDTMLKGNYVPNLITKQIDILTTLYAVQQIEQTDIDSILSLNDNGLQRFLDAHKTYSEEARHFDYLDDSQIQKGYHKLLTNTDYHTTVAYRHQEAEMQKLGYVMVRPLDIKTNDAEYDGYIYAVYKSPLSPTISRDSSIFALIGESNADAIVPSVLFSSGDVELYRSRRNSSTSELGLDVFLHRASRIADSIDRYIAENGINGLDEYIAERTIGYTRINYTPPIRDDSDGDEAIEFIQDYKIMLSHTEQKQLLDKDTNGITLLSRQYGSALAKLEGQRHNEEVLRLLLEHAESFQKADKMQASYDWTQLTSASDDPVVKEAYRLLPDNIKAYIGNLENPPLMVRRDALLMLLGVPQGSLARDIKLIKNKAPRVFKRIIEMAETIQRFVASMMKLILYLEPLWFL